MTDTDGPAELRFDGRSAIVTGAGRGLGRAYALALAARGCKVLVADLGCEADGSGRDPAVAAAVAEEICAAGGYAQAMCVDVAETGSPKALIDAALTAFGRLDALVNNVGGSRTFAMPDLLGRTVEDLADTVRLNLQTALAMCRTSWPIFADQGYGRIVNISSSAAIGMVPAYDYGAAKAGIIGLTRSLALAGGDDIKINAVMPLALTRMMGRNLQDEDLRRFAAAELAPEMVAPIVVMLCHESCPVTGETFSSAGRIVARVLLSETEGRVFDQLSPEAILRDIDAVLDTASVRYFTSAEAQARDYALRRLA